MPSISQGAAEKILASIRIPPCPGIITELIEERRKDNPDLMKIARTVARDIVLSAAMLKTVNSPFFGLRCKIDSIEKAVVVMGFDNVVNILTGLVLRNMKGSNGAHLDRFWDTAVNTATTAVLISRRIPGISHSAAYTAGLFHDCGMPLMMERFPDYNNIMSLAEIDGSCIITDIEDARYSTNHATVGYLLSKSWNLSEAISLTILHHHNVDMLSSNENLPDEVCGLIAVTQIAEALTDSQRMREYATWRANGAMLLSYLGLSEAELDDIIDIILQDRC